MGEVVATTELATPIVGTLRLAATARGLVKVALPRGAFAGWLANALPDSERVTSLPVLEQARRELVDYFAGRRHEFDVPLDLRGTPFQVAVWNALARVPYGETRSYRDIARAVRRPRAFRAVGAANGANPVPVIVPCHRVIAATGRLGGYGGGLEAKRRLLAFEQSHSGRDLV